MAQTENGNSKKGFASMDTAKQREIASKGGRASAKGDTSRRGFASMDKNKQREISSQGGRSQGHRRQLRKEQAMAVNQQKPEAEKGSETSKGSE